jgi:hypothetical protein
MKISPVGHVILREQELFSEVDRHCPRFENSSYGGCASASLEIDGFRTKAGFGRSGSMPSEARLEL